MPKPRVPINKAIAMIEEIVREVEVGKIYEAKVVKIEEFGCFVQLWPGCEGLCHVSPGFLSRHSALRRRDRLR